MSIRVMTWVWQSSPEKGSALLLLLAIADFADDRGLAYPAVATLASKIRMSPRNTRILLDKLTKNDALEVDRGAGPRGCNLFRVKGLQAELFDEGGVKKIALGGETAIAPEPSLEPSLEPSYTPDFEKAWKTYPKRAGNNLKKDAFKVWNTRLKAGVAVEAMQAGAERYAGFIRATDKESTEYVMTASRFFGPSKPFEQDWTPPSPKAHKAVDAWWADEKGIERKGKELGLTPLHTEDYHHYKARINAELRKREGATA